MMSIIKRCIKGIKKLIDNIRFRIKLQQMDDMWYLFGGSCWGLFPPSFYYTHTEDEIKRIEEETIKELYEMLEQLE